MEIVCTKCKEEKDSSEFCKRTNSKTGFQPACKSCMNLAYRVTRAKSSGRYKQVQKDREEMYVKRYQDWKATLKCSVCPENSPCCLEFHHTDPSEKENTVSNMVRCSSWDTLMLEVAKCVVLCSNCHKKVHAGVLII